MRRLLVLACGVLGLALPASAGAAINTGASAGDIANSITTAGVTGAAFDPVVPTGQTPVAVSDTPLGGFPIQGPDYAILTNGNVTLAANAQNTTASVATGSSAPARGPTARDVTVLRVDLNVPEQANCLTIGFRFLSEEFPGFVGGSYNDAFIAEVDPGTAGWTANADTTITAERNFAFDAQGEVISVNTSGVSQMTAAEAAGTVYGGATPRLSAAQAVTPGSHSLYLSIFDQGDSSLDSAVFLDRVAFLATEPGGCVAGAQSDEVPPAVTLGVSQSTPDDATPTLSGAAGTAPGDGSAVTVKIYAGGAVAGAPVQTPVATRSGSAWSVDAAALPPGTYTAQAEQADIAGNTGLSAPATFTVAQQQVLANQSQSPVPVLGKSVVAGRVSGTIRVKTKRGKFRKLGANESIPLGSTVDATKGKVRITSAAGPGGATQSALFFQGAFVITQTGGSKPVTELALSGKLSCPKGKKASTSAKKKVRRLWGDGKGRFRTKGKHGAATVRGTKWLTQDSCSGTLVRVKRGTVTVRDFAKKKTVVVKKGKAYVARPGK
jgi:hypothetical protein